jgi:hypothetical protein
MWNSDQMSVKEAANQNSIGKSCDVAIKFIWRNIIDTYKGGLAIVAMRHWSQGPLKSPIQNVKKGPFGGILENLAQFSASVPYDFNKIFRKFDGIHLTISLNFQVWPTHIFF